MQHFLHFKILVLCVTVSHAIYLTIISSLFTVHLMSEYCSSISVTDWEWYWLAIMTTLLYIPLWYCFFLPPQQIASSKSTRGSKTTSPISSETDIIQKANLLQKATTEILYIIFGECRGRVRMVENVIHFNGAVSVLLATFAARTSFSFI